MSLDAFDSHLPVRNQEDPNLLKGTFQGFGTAGNPSGGVVTIQGTPGGSPVTVISLDDVNADGVPSGYVSNASGGLVLLSGGATGVVAQLLFTNNGYLKKIHFSCGGIGAFEVRVGTNIGSAVAISGVNGLTSAASKRDVFEFAIPRFIPSGNTIFVVGKNGDSSPTTNFYLNSYVEGYQLV